MSETPTPAPPAPDPPQPPEPKPEPVPTGEDDNRIPRERLNQESAKRKAAEKELADLRRQLEERENAGLPELERERKAREKAEQRLQEAERRIEEADRAIQRTTRERWVTSVAQAENFADPSDAAAFVDLDNIEDERDAERAVKRLAKSKPHLLKAEEPQLPGRLLRNGQPPPNQQQDPVEAQRQAEGQMIYDGIQALRRQSWSTGG